jgi:(p)ppGpp synthase/HD superfamily hydrolase
MYETGEKKPENIVLEVPYCTAERIIDILHIDGIWSERIELAFGQAVETHQAKTRDNGGPYLDEHIFPVTNDVLEYLRYKNESDKVKELAVTVALLHDTVEDDPNIDLVDCERTFGREVSKLVYPLTRYGIDHGIYIQKIFNAPELDKIIKLFDRLNNLTCSVLLAQKTNPTEKSMQKLARYTEETANEYLPIADQLLDKQIFNRLLMVVDLAFDALDLRGYWQ